MTETFRVEWADVARQDLDEIADYLHRESPAAALRLVERIEHRASTLETMPHRGRVPPELVRFRVPLYHEIQVPPFRLLYRIHADSVAVLGVFDGRRDLEDVIIGRLLSL
ncbi:MAG: type II toxin-antitoxin system RelE/ParE family toxin [bacterium]|nr:type II toxin-antitoxin system RelE/ParE family toxin [bacterium]